MAKKKYDLNSAIDEIWSGYENGATSQAADASNSQIDDIWNEYEKQPRRKISPPTKPAPLKQSVDEDPLAAFSEADRQEMMRINTGAVRNPVVRPTGKTSDLEKRREAELRRNAELVGKNRVSTIGPDRSKKATDELNILEPYSLGVTERLLGNLPKGQFRDKLIDAASVPENLLRGLDVGTKQMVADTANLGSLAERLVTGKDRSFWFDPLRDDFERMAQESMEAGNVLQGPLGNFARTSAVAVPQIVTTLYAGQALTKAPMLAKVAARFPGLVKMLPFSLTSGGGYAREAQKEGANNWQQLGYGAAGGALEGLTEKYMFGNLEEVLAGGKKAVQKALINIPFEAGQEAGIDPLTGLAKKAIYQHDMPWVGEGGVIDPQQMKDDAIAGAGTALLTGGTGLAVNSRARNKYLIGKMHREVSDALLKNGAVESPTEAMILGGMMVEGAVKDAGGVNYNSLRQIAEINRELASKHPVGELQPETVDQINQVVENMQQLGVPEEQVRQMVETAVQNGLTAASENLTKPSVETAETPQIDQETVQAGEPAQPENRPNLAHFLGAAGLFSPIARPAAQNTVQVATPAETVTEMPEAEVVTPQIDKTEKQTPVEEQSTDVAIPEVQSPTIVGPQETNYQVEQVVDKMGQEKGTTQPPSQVEMQTPIEVKTPVASEATVVHETPEQPAEILNVQSKGEKRIVSFKYPNEEFKVEINPDGKYSVYYKNSKKPIEQYPKEVKKALDNLVNTISQPGVEQRTPVEEQAPNVTEAPEKGQKTSIPKKSQPVYNGLKTNQEEKMPDDSPRENNQGTPDAVRRHGDHALEGKQAPDVPGTEEKRGTVRDGVQRPADGEGSPGPDDRAGSGLLRSAGDRDQHLHTELKDKKPKPKEKLNSHNFKIQSEADMGVTETGQKTRYHQNVAAIKLLKQLEAEGRQATPEEQKMLAKYVGWGGIKDVFNRYNYNWRNEREELQKLLTPEEYAAADGSKLNAHYTSKTMIDGMYQALQRLGFKGGRVLEPSMGVGNFFGLMPQSLAAASRLTGVELDSITGRLAQQLYPDADVRVQGFEKLNVPDNFYDLAISNVPFGNYPVADSKYQKFVTQRIHNYFFAKALDKVRPGGVVMFITHSGTLNASDLVGKGIRNYLSERAELIGAIRLPNTAFKSNSGTEVTTDLIILQKKGEGVKARPTNWVNTEAVSVDNVSVIINSYFVQHPEMVLGAHATTGNMHGPNEYTVTPTGELADQLAAALQKLPRDIFTRPVHKATEGAKASEIIPPDATAADTREGKVFIREGRVLKIANGQAVPVSVTAKDLPMVKQYLELEKIVRDLFRLQLQNVPDSALTGLQKALNRAYDGFAKQYGNLHAARVKAVFDDDPDFPLVLSIEDYDPKTKIVSKGAFFSKRVRRPYVRPTKADTTPEALAISLNEYGRVDLDRIRELTGKTPENILSELAGLVFENPNGGLETADQYLAGNVREKLAEAESAARLEPKYRANVVALKAVQPEDLKPGDLAFSLGQPWIPLQVYTDFLQHIFPSGGLEMQFQATTGEWLINGDATVWKKASQSVENNLKWGTPRVDALKLLEMAFNQKKPTVYDSVDDKRVMNPKATEAAREKQNNLKDEFRQWVLADAKRAQELTDKYNWEYNNLRVRTFDGSHLQFPGMTPAMTMRPHQKNAIWRYLQGGNCLFAHCVGAGKTFEMVASVIEARRLGILQKPVIVVPKSRLRGTAEDALQLYPGAKVLVADDKNFSKDKRKQFMAKIATGDYDIIIMSHNNFQTISLSEATVREFFQRQLDELEAAREAEVEAGNRQKRGFESNLTKAKKTLTARMNEAIEKVQKKQDTANVTFEELGIDGILVDEAHYYKNLFYGTAQRVAGLGSTAGNQMTFDLLMKIQYLRQLNGGRGVAFATGTPVANSLAEMYSLQRYLQPDELEKRSLHNFDMWASVFGKIVSVLEMSPEGGGFRVKEKFAQFNNLPELVQLFRSFADVQTAEMLKLPVPKLKGGKRQTVIAKPSPEFKDFLNNELLPRAEAYRKNPAAAKPEEMLEITRLGRLAALDMRLIKPGLADDPNSKVNQAVANIFDIWKDSRKDRLTQAVFLDLSTPKRDKEENGVGEDEAGDAAESTFNLSVYQDIKQKLIKKGIPAEEIAFVHDAKTDIQKQKLFKRVNDGEIRVVIGSTNKMGVGVNMQDRLVALHHLDCPWRPVDIEQREGRILRQGNKNEEVQIVNYVTEGSFDAFMWDKVQQKALFISQIMAGKISGRNAEDVGDMVLNAAEIAACASGNPLTRERATLNARFRQLEMLRSAHQNEQYNLKFNQGRIPAKIAKLQETVAAISQDLKHRQNVSGDQFTMKLGKKTFVKRAEADEALVKLLQAAEPNKVIGSIAGFDLVTEPKASEQGWELVIKGEHSYYPTVSVRGIETKLRDMEKILDTFKGQLEEAQRTQAAIDAEVNKPFDHEDEYQKVAARLKEIDAELNLDSQEEQDVIADPEAGLVAADTAGKASAGSYADTGGYADIEPEVRSKTSSKTNSKTSPKSGSAQQATADVNPLAIELPELLELVQQINEGKLPLLREKLGKALGKFSFKDGQGQIKLRRDIFLGERLAQVELNFRKDIQAQIDAFTKQVYEQYGQADIVFRRESGTAYIAYRRDPTLAAKVLAHEIGHLVDWLPEKTMSRGNLLGRIASLKRYMRQLLAERPGAADLTEKDKRKLRYQAFKLWQKDKKGTPQALYQKLVRQEIAKRRLFELKNLQAELKGLTQVWKPFDEAADPKYTKYRYSAPELYADAFSVLINNPGLLKQKAPNFYRAFFNYLERKPEVKAIYDEIQQRIGDSAQKLNHRLDRTYRNFTEGHVRRNELNQRRRLKAKTVVDTLLAGLVDRNQGTLKLVRQYEKGEEQEAALARQARWQLEETSYISAEADHYMYELGQQVLKPLEAAGLTVDDLGVYLFHQRVIHERADLANPEGYGAKTSIDMLEAIRGRLGDEAFKKLEQLAMDYRKLREEQIISRVSDSRMFSQDTIKMMQERKHYAKFSVQHYLAKSYGTGTTARIMKQVGTINKIENPLVVTVLNDLSMLRAAKINEAKLAVVAFLQEIEDAKTGVVITPARTRRNPVTQRQEAVAPQESSLALLDVMVEGEVHSFYVAKEIAESFEYRPFEATRVAEIWGLVMGPLKAMLVSKNPIWIARNFIRDLRTTYKNIPELKGKQLWKFLKYYGQSFGEVKQAVFKGERSADLSAMYQNFMLNPNRQYDSRERNFENDLERLADEFQLGLYDEGEAKGVKGRLKAFAKWLDRWGQVSEQTSKLAGYKFLTNETKRSAAEIGHVVRTRIGTPDVRRVGKWHQVTNSLFLFSNVNKEGWRAMQESYQDNPGAYIWKTIWTNFLPKLILTGLAAGVARGLGDDDDWWKQLIDAIPDYDKRSYNILPLGMTPDGKAVYFRLPEDYEGQIFGVLAYTLFKGRILGKDGLLAQAAEQLPYDWDNPNPYFGIAHDLWQYYINEQNPVDEYRGRNVLPRKIFEAGGWEANQRMLGYAWQGLGGSALYTPATDLDENIVQKLLKWPGLNILGSFLKISDRGTYEDYYEEKDQETQAKARKALDIEKRVKADVKKIHGTPTIDDAENLYDRLVNAGILSEEESFGRFFSQRYLGYAGKAVADSRLGMILKARSKVDRAKLLYKAKKELAPKAYEGLKEKLAGLDLWADEIMEEE